MTQQEKNHKTDAKLHVKQTQNRRKNFSVSLALFFGVSLVLPLMGQAAELYLETAQPEYAPNETFSVDLRLNVTPPEDINAIEAYLKFPNNILEAVDFSTANSILTFIKNPVINQQNGLISFSGIVPGGYTGRLTGDPGKSNLLGKAIFKAKKQEKETALINFLANSQALLNDGKGTKANVTFVPLEIKISSQEVVFNPLNEWEKAKEEDKILPEEFKPEIVKIDDQYFLVFNTQDKQSGIAYYAIRETRRKISLKRETPKESLQLPTGQAGAKWVEVESPYVLKDQKLQSYIYVKAIDKAGNERIAVVEPRYPVKRYEQPLIWGIIILGFVVAYLVGRILWKKSRNIRKT